jgi:hypothetical protein
LEDLKNNQSKISGQHLPPTPSEARDPGHRGGPPLLRQLFEKFEKQSANGYRANRGRIGQNLVVYYFV